MRPRIRSIKPETWQDRKIGNLSHGARLLWLGMVTLADDEGRFQARRSILWGHAFPHDEDASDHISEWVAEVQKQGSVLFYKVDGAPYGAFRNWKRHQRINRPTPSDLPPPPDPKVVRANRVPKKNRSERAGNDPGGITESSLSTHSLTRRRAFRSDPNKDPVPVLERLTAEMRTRELCYRLGWHIMRNDEKAAPKWDSRSWQKEMRLLVMDRGGGEEAFLEVERIIDWCQADSFWRSNILSPAKLRKQFTQLALKAKSNVVSLNGRQSAGDLIDKLNRGEGA